MIIETLSAEAIDVLERVKKLLALANNNDNEHQAQAASQKAMELLAKHNLDMAMVGHTAKGKQGSNRSDNKRKGGLYGWQRALWKSVSELNFCMYWALKGNGKGATYEHRILGRAENVLAAEIMAEYLQSTVERLAQRWAKDQGYSSVFVSDAIAYREGMATRLTERLADIRRERLAEDERKKKEHAAAAKHPGAAPGNSLVLADVISDENDLNNDHLNGWDPGTTARKRKEQEEYSAKWWADWQEKQAEAKRVQDEWDAAHPEEAAARKDIERKAQEKADRDRQKRWAKQSSKPYNPRYRADTPAEARARTTAFREGSAKGNEIGLDQQVGNRNKERLG